MGFRSGTTLSFVFLALLLLLGACSEGGGDCRPGRLACPCIDAETCAGVLVCDGQTFLCRSPLRCEDLGCGAHQLCREAATGEDAACLEDCLPGYAWGEVDRVCAQSPASCEPGVPTSILAECQALKRECVALGAGAECGACLPGMVPGPRGACEAQPVCNSMIDAICAEEGRRCLEGQCGQCLEGWVAVVDECHRQTCSYGQEPGALGLACEDVGRECLDDGLAAAECGACFPGFVEQDDGVCRPANTCARLNCAQFERLCLPDELSGEATCADCRAGFEEHGGVCRALTGLTCDPSEGSLVEACAAENRSCDEGGASGAACGACLDGYVVSPDSDLCVEPQPCSALDCEALLRLCDPEPTAHCTTCQPGLIEAAAGYCRPPLTCAVLQCGEWDCQEAPAGVVMDAWCESPCPGEALWNGVRCVACPPCDDPVMEEGPEDRPTISGSCICRTRPGYFYSLANESGTVPCDADGDGWVRESARVMIESGDPVLIDNTRCEIRAIENIVLHNDLGQQRNVIVAPPLQLFESVRNDDDQVLRIHWDRAQLSRDYWGADDMGIQASVLNRFTKLCHDPRADYNDNGYGDPYEYAAALPSPGFRPEQAPFNLYSYFLELHRGWYAPSAADALLGDWHIAERVRQPEEAAGAPLRYPEGEDLCPAGEEGCRYWRECLRRRDSQADSLEPQVGMDLATEMDSLAEGPAWLGMNHHSQFKCVVIRDVVAAGSPQERTAEQAASEFVLNRCATDGPVWVEDHNPANPTITCSLETEEPSPNTALWGLVPYDHYPPDASHSGYERGCINGCAEALRAWGHDPDDLRCPGLAENTPRCTVDQGDYGRLVCLEVMCDGLDNDQDQLTDEDVPDPSEICVTGEETSCCFTGQAGVCNLGTVTGCDGPRPNCLPALAGLEYCDDRDNDCDGETDEALDGVPCAFASPIYDLPEGSGLPGVCGDRLTLCVDGVWGCVPRELYQPGDETVCDGLDNDCDGLIDEQLHGQQVGADDPAAVFDAACVPAEPRPGVCMNSIWQCVAGRAECYPVDPYVDDESCSWDNPDCFWLCDGLDNDCDGAIDNGKVCRRRYADTWRVYPVADSGHNAWSRWYEVEMLAELLFSGVGTPYLNAKFTVIADEWVTIAEQNFLAVHGRKTEEREIDAGGIIGEIVDHMPQGDLGDGGAYMGQDLAVFYRDHDWQEDSLYPPSLASPDETVLDVRSDSAAVTRLVCRGVADGLISPVTHIFPVEQCDTYFCDDAFDLCFGHPGADGCDAAWSCTLGCGSIESYGYWNCRDTCFNRMSATAMSYYSGIRNCCEQFLPILRDYEAAYCEVDFAIEYDVVQAPGRCPGQPTAEVCDGCDNDHDGQVDESFPGIGSPCGTDVGVCQPGQVACIAGFLVCSGGIQPLETEPVGCNGLDEDCDGVTDDGVREPCVTSCGWGTMACDSSECLAGDCPILCGAIGYRACADGETIFGACSYPEMPIELCNGEDDDCDGEVDESFPGAGEACGSDEGQCQLGILGCQAGESVCLGDVEPSNETCDELDNDCDGITDFEGCACSQEGATQPCGIDVGTCELGTRACAGGVWGVCEGVIGPSLEICDGADNDCDGETDESFPGQGQACGSNLGQCIQGYQGCEAGNPVCVGEVPPSEEICDFLDNDCDGIVDKAGCGCSVPMDEPCGLTDEGACRLGVRRCHSGAWTECAWAVLPSPESCNGLDDDCDGQTDEEPLAGPAGLGETCGSAIGLCAQGVITCVAGQAICLGEVLPSTEICDFQDNDCDGVVDFEGCPCVATEDEPCGLTDEGECQMGARSCQAGAWTGCLGATFPAEEVCDGLDNDCDGETDEGMFCADCHLVSNVNGTGLSIEFCTVVSAGESPTFWMGCRDDLNGALPCLTASFIEVDRPQHAVTLGQGFEIMRTEVTVDQYEHCVDAGAPGCTPISTCLGNISNYGLGFQQQPITCISKPQAEAFAAWIGGRLPSEAEWEYAARGPMASADDYTIFPWGNADPDCTLANYGYVCTTGAHPGEPLNVGSLSPAGESPFGVQNMGGNVMEWTADCYVEGYAGAPVDGSPRMTGCDGVSSSLRGGTHWVTPVMSQNSSRMGMDGSVNYLGVGARAVRPLP